MQKMRDEEALPEISEIGGKHELFRRRHWWTFSFSASLLKETVHVSHFTG